MLESQYPIVQEFQVKGPSGEQIQDLRDKTSEKLEFVAHKSGVHKFCFTNKSPYHETIDFDVHVGHFSYYEQHAKDGRVPMINSLVFVFSCYFLLFHKSLKIERKCHGNLQMLAEHFNPLLEQIAKLEEALYNIQFEQHWLEAQTDRQAIGTI